MISLYACVAGALCSHQFNDQANWMLMYMLCVSMISL